MKKLIFIVVFFSMLLFSAEPRTYSDENEDVYYEPPSLEKVGSYPFPTNPLNDRARGYLLKGKVKNCISNYGNFIDWEQFPMGMWGEYTYLPNVGFLAGAPGQSYSYKYQWVEPEIPKIELGGGLYAKIWGSYEAYEAWYSTTDSGIDTNFVGVLFNAADDDGDVGTKLEIMDPFTNLNQWKIDDASGQVLITSEYYSEDEEIDPNLASARIGLIRPWAIRPNLDQRTDEYDLYEYGEDQEEWTADDEYIYYGANVVESYLTRRTGSSNTEWQASLGSRQNTHNTELSAGDLFGDTPYTDEGDTYPLLAHSDHSATWPTRYNEEADEYEPFWPGWWAENYNEELPGCSGLRRDPACWEESPGRFISDTDVYLEFDDRWAHRGNMVSTDDEYLQTGYPFGIRVMASAHSYGVAYAEDVMFVTVKVRNESGDFCAFERDRQGNKVPVVDGDGNQICGEGMVLPDGTKLRQGRGFNYKDMTLGFYFDADAVWSDANDNTGVHTNDDDFMEYYDERYVVNQDSIIISMAMIYDLDGVSNTATDIGIVAVQLLDSPLATEVLDFDNDGYPERYPGEPLKMTDWHWFDWYNRPAVVNRETNAGPFAGADGVPQARNKEEITYKIMAGDTTNLSDKEKTWHFHTPDPVADLDEELNPHFDSLEGLGIEFPDGLDCVLIMSCGPFDLEIGEEVPFSFTIIFGQNPDDLISNAKFAQIMYNSHYQGYTPPTTPNVFATVEHGKITITWDSVAEQSKDVVTGYADFEGYKIYKSTDGGTNWGKPEDKIYDNDGVFVGWRPLAQFDLTEDQDIEHCVKSNDICTGDDRRGIEISGPDPLAPWFSLGTNNGLEHGYIDTNVVDGMEYTYSVTAYDMGIRGDTYYEGDPIDTVFTEDGSIDYIIYSHYTLPSNSNPEQWSAPNGYESIEGAKGTTIHDPNFITAVPGYRASNITFPDLSDTDAFITTNENTIGNGERSYTIVNVDDLSNELIRMEIQAELTTDSYEGFHSDNPVLYVYEINNLVDQLPSDYYDTSTENLSDTEIEDLLDLPGAFADGDIISIPNYITDDYNIVYKYSEGYENNFSDFFNGIRLRFDNHIQNTNNEYGNYVPFNETVVSDTNLINIVGFWMEYADETNLRKRPPYEYMIEFSSSIIDTARLSTGEDGCSGTPFYFPKEDNPSEFYNRVPLPFKVTNITTGEKVGIWHTNRVTGNVINDDYGEYHGNDDCVWQPLESLALYWENVTTVKANGEVEEDEEYIFDLNIFISDIYWASIVQQYGFITWSENRNYDVGDYVYFSSLLYQATESIQSSILPNEWIDDDEDGLNDNPWQVIYPWEDGDYVIVTPSRWYVDGDSWVADLSKLGKPHDVTEDMLKQVKVVPNPYIVHSAFNETEHVRKLRFTHLPQECKITIFTITGEKVITLEHEDEYDSNLWWNLRTVNNQEVAPGLYLYTVESEGKKHIGKFSVVR